MFSILILTYNEEQNLNECLDSISWCDDVWVLDSGSSDKTVEIAKSRGCKLLSRKFDNFGDQRNYAIDNAQFKYKWVFDLDADERFTQELKAECEAVIEKDEKSAYYCSYKNIMWGKWLKHSTNFPVYQMRLHKLGEIRFEPFGHGQKEGPAERGIGYLKEPYIHYNFSKGLKDWFAKHVEYGYREALLRIEEDENPLLFNGKDKISRRRRLKRLSYHVPFRPLFKFLYTYFWRLGFLDGGAGLQFSLMQVWAIFMYDSIYKDMKRQRKNQ